MPALTALAAELCDLKRLRDAASPESLASRLFRRAWAALLAGEAPDRVALATTADALAALRLGGIDAAVLARLGVPAADVPSVLAAASTRWRARSSPRCARPCARRWARPSAPAAGCRPCRGPDPPAACRRHLPGAAAHRAGAAGGARRPLPGGGGAGRGAGAAATARDPARAFLAGLAHHLHNADLPDSGFAGEMLLGAHLAPVMARLFAGRHRHAAAARWVPPVRDGAGTDRDGGHAGGPRLPRRRRDRPRAADAPLRPGGGLHDAAGAGRHGPGACRARCRRSTTW